VRGGEKTLRLKELTFCGSYEHGQVWAWNSQPSTRAFFIGCEDVVEILRGTHMRGVPANGAYIKAKRRSRGLTQEALANAARCDIKTVYRAENDAHLDMSTLTRLALALRVPYRRVIKANEDG
jgi:hypothetical protein